jgi:hypothetical protein
MHEQQTGVNEVIGSRRDLVVARRRDAWSSTLA